MALDEDRPRARTSVGVNERRSWTAGAAAAVPCFAAAGWRYWTSVYPVVCRELDGWRRAADAVPDESLRTLAVGALRKRSNMEGAAAFCAFSPASHRAAAVRATVAFQTAYNYLDVLSEQRSERPGAQARTLHHALVAAVTPSAPCEDFYADSAWSGRDGGHLERLILACRQALEELPALDAIRPALGVGAERIVEFQARLGEAAPGRRVGDERAGDRDAEEETTRGGSLAGWAAAATPPGCGLRWWESAAAAGSSLGIYVLIAAAADARLGEEEVAAIERAYFPWIGALHSLLDSVVDVAEDAASGQHSLFAGYAARREAKARMGMLARASKAQAAALPHPARHLVVIAGMCGMYLSARESRRQDVREVREEVLAEVGALARVAILVFAARRGVERSKGAPGLSGCGEASRLRGSGPMGIVPGGVLDA